MLLKDLTSLYSLNATYTDARTSAEWAQGKVIVLKPDGV